MQYDISDSELALELSPEVQASAMKSGEHYTQKEMYPYRIQRIRHFEPTDMCSRLELRRWINSNPHTIRNILFTEVNTRELLQRILSAARSIKNAAVARSLVKSQKIYPSRWRSHQTTCLSVERRICNNI